MIKMTEELQVYANGLVHCSICTNVKSKKRIEELVNLKNPTGLNHKWKVDMTQHFATGQTNPCPCERKSTTHKHYLMVC